MQRMIRAFEKINTYAGCVSGVCICCAALLIILEILIRSATRYSLYITDEYTGYLMAVSSILGLGFVEMHHAHIRMDLIDLLEKKLPRLCHFIKLCAYSLAIIVAVYIVFVSWKLFWRSYIYQSRSTQISATLLAIPQAFLPLGAILLTVQYIINLYKFASGTSKK